MVITTKRRRKMKKNALFQNIFLLSACIFFMAGCGPGKIDLIVINDMPAVRSGNNHVQVIRTGEGMDAVNAMELKQGDEVVTDSRSRAVIWLWGNSRLFLGPDTHIRLVNPSHIIELISKFGDKISKLFVDAGQSLQVNTLDVTYGNEGTEFEVTLEPGNITTLTVLKGAVRISSKTAAFSPLRITRFNRCRVVPGNPPVTKKINREQANEIMEWVNALERVSSGKTTRLLTPDLTGLSLANARRLIYETGLAPGSLKGRITGRYPLNTIVDQKPRPGTRLNRKGIVHLLYEAEATHVPDLVGKRIHFASSVLSGKKLKQGRVDHKITGRYPADTIVSQHPLPGSRVMTGTTVTLVVEAPSVIVPQLINRQINQARQILYNANLKPGQVRTELSDSPHAGIVQHQSINAGTRVRPGTEVHLTMTEAGSKVPHIVNQNHKTAVQQLRNAGLSPGRISRQTSAHHAANTVLSCSPGQGSLVRRGTRVNLVVSVRPARQTPQVSKCTVPNVMNMTKEAALARLKQYRLNGIVDLQMSGNFVSKQLPSAGTVVPCGSTIRLNIGTLY
jgi:beta-lactam-binding protein with PASTA domain